VFLFLRQVALREWELARAHAAERAGQLDAAVAEAEQALALAPEAPDILQYRAELEVARGQWQQAEQFAIRSFTLGPKVGGLCARNWQTVVEARLALDDAATMAQAKKRLAECRVKPRLRM
jgi:tetratricopeptide (TPR) repeat protein